MFKYINQTCISILFRFWIATVSLQRFLVDIYGMIIRTTKLRLPKVEFRFDFFFAWLFFSSSFCFYHLISTAICDYHIRHFMLKIALSKTFQHWLETGHFSTRAHACTHCQRLMYIHTLILLVYLQAEWKMFILCAYLALK